MSDTAFFVLRLTPALLLFIDITLWRRAATRVRDMPRWTAFPGAMICAAIYWFLIQRRKYE